MNLFTAMLFSTELRAFIQVCEERGAGIFGSTIYIPIYIVEASALDAGQLISEDEASPFTLQIRRVEEYQDGDVRRRRVVEQAHVNETFTRAELLAFLEKHGYHEEEWTPVEASTRMV